VSNSLKLAGQLGAVGLVLALLGLLVWKVASGDEPDARVGKQAPGFTLPRLDDTDATLSLGQYRGKAVVVNFWASWCGPCRDEAPLLQDAWEQRRADGLVVLGVDTRDFLGDGREFVRDFGLTYPNVYDGSAKLVGPWGLTGFPETFVLDADGVIVEHVVGPIEDAEQLEGAIEKALA
jgi:cytochrome c biogenesis protein CcmG/thiol:disulfide interchange protein DsbE